MSRTNAVDLVIGYVENHAAASIDAETRLPNEDAIAGAVGVSRGPVREAMKVLEALGAVDIRRGVGTFLRPNGLATLRFARDFQKAMQDAKPEQLFELRLTMEQAAAAYAAERRSDGDLAKMRLCNEEMATFSEGPKADLDALTRADVRFHAAVYEAGGNPALAVLGRFVTEIVSPAIREGHARVGGLRSVRNHERIIDSIADRDPARAEREAGISPVMEGLAKWKAAIAGQDN